MQEEVKSFGILVSTLCFILSGAQQHVLTVQHVMAFMNACVAALFRCRAKRAEK